MIDRNCAVDVLLLAVGIAAAVESLNFGIWTPDGGPGNGFFPLLVASVAAIGAASSLIIDLRGAPPDNSMAPLIDSLDPVALEPVTSLAKPLAYSAIMLVMAIAIRWTGFYSAMGLCLIVILWRIENMQWARAMGAAACALIVTHLVFERALGVRLPHGLFW